MSQKAAQNGHLEVVKLLLDAGALSYVFSKDGYTPLDFLYKFKMENGTNFSTVELNLYNEIFDKMVSSIKGIINKRILIFKMFFNFFSQR